MTYENQQIRTILYGSAYYFAARYSRHPEMRRNRDALIAALPYAVVTSQWIDCHNGELEASHTPAALNANPAGCWRHGSTDIEDLQVSTTLVSFTGDGGGGKGGRHVEYGYAMAAALRLVIVGPRENIFHCDPRAEVYPAWADFLTHETGGQDG